MAKIGSKGLVDDGSPNLQVDGVISTGTFLTSSNGSFAELSTIGNNLVGQVFGAPNTFVQVTQWLTGAMTSPGAVPVTTGSLSIVQGGMYFTSVCMSFSGSAGTYTFSLFVNGQQHANSQLQTTIAAGQSFPVALTLNDYNVYNPGDSLDVRVKCNNAGANFQLGNGNFLVFRTVG